MAGDADEQREVIAHELPAMPTSALVTSRRLGPAIWRESPSSATAPADGPERISLAGISAAPCIDASPPFDCITIGSSA